ALRLAQSRQHAQRVARGELRGPRPALGVLPRELLPRRRVLAPRADQLVDVAGPRGEALAVRADHLPRRPPGDQLGVVVRRDDHLVLPDVLVRADLVGVGGAVLLRDEADVVLVHPRARDAGLAPLVAGA